VTLHDYCGACETWFNTRCPDCGGPHGRRCDQCRRYMQIMGPAPAPDALILCSAECARDWTEAHPEEKETGRP